MRLAMLLFVLGACGGDLDTGDDAPDGGGQTMVDAPPSRTVDITGPDVLPHVQAFANAVCTDLDACTISTYNGHSPTAAQALDILVSDEYGERPTDNNVFGDAVAQWSLDHTAEFAVTYVIFRQRYNDGSGWDPMEDRGSITQNHFDHVHISFDASL